MQVTYSQIVRLDFEQRWHWQLINLVNKRKTKMSQSVVAKCLDVSLKTIQRFEAGKSYNALIMFGYKKLFK